VLLIGYHKIPRKSTLDLFKFIRGFGWALYWGGGHISGIRKKMVQNDEMKCI